MSKRRTEACEAVHDDLVREQFTAQAATFTGHGWAAAGLGWVVDLLEPEAGEVVLDVAAGAAHVGRVLAPLVGHVSALDMTPAMVEQGRRLADAAGQGNIAFVLGDAAALPFRDEHFDLVVCRLTLHQVADPAAVVSEMVRVTRPSGRVGVIDMVADPDPEVAAETNRLERLRDPSHGRTLTVGEHHDLLRAAGASVESVHRRDNVVELEDWLERTRTPPAVRGEIRRRLAEDLAGGSPSGLRPIRVAGPEVLSLTHRWVATIARAIRARA